MCRLIVDFECKYWINSCLRLVDENMKDRSNVSWEREG